MRRSLERALQFMGFQGMGKAGRSRLLFRGGEVVEAAALARGCTRAEAGEFEDVVAHTAQHVFGLEQSSASEAGANVQGVEPGHANEELGIRLGRRLGWSGVTEDQLEIGADGSEFFLGPEGDIYLQGIL